MKKITLIGAGGHGKVVADIAQICGYDKVFFLDARWPTSLQNGPWPVIGTFPRATAGAVFCTIGNNTRRGQILDSLDSAQIPVLCHPSAVVSAHATISIGSVLCPGAIVNIDAQIGRGVILNTGATVDHDCVLGNFVHISPGAHLAGAVTIGDYSWIGIGACIREGVSIGKNVRVAAGAVVVTDLADYAQVMGVPARQK